MIIVYKRKKIKLKKMNMKKISMIKKNSWKKRQNFECVSWMETLVFI